jgi:hypothetical protein
MSKRRNGADSLPVHRAYPNLSAPADMISSQKQYVCSQDRYAGRQ